MQITPSSCSSQTQGTANPRALAELFKLELGDMFNQWNVEKPLRTGYPHASSILADESVFCLRQLVLAATRPEAAERPETRPWDSHQNAVFLHGWTLHEKWQNLLSKYGQVLEVETSHFDEVRLLHFTPDAIISFCGMQFVVEIKGYKSSHFEVLREDGEPPRAAHVQANLYMHLLQLRHAFILVECKDTQEYKVWCVEYEKALAQPYLDRLYRFKVALHKARSGEWPGRCCRSRGDQLAGRCVMREVCFGERVELAAL